MATADPAIGAGALPSASRPWRQLLRTARRKAAGRPASVPAVLAPALPALVLLAVTVAATADPPPAGPLRLPGVQAVVQPGPGGGVAVTGPAYPVTPR